MWQGGGGVHGRGHAWWWVCMAGVVCMAGGHAWQGVCMARGACMAGGACVAGGMHGGGAWHMCPPPPPDTMRYGDTVSERSVCILLQCIPIWQIF